ncbi:NAD(P)-binding protein [Hesseltinella vesiculosa]|uniref:2,4-dienoyl-CoA reductase [(3E)-enoyl-CoA-producing] n=1 Tax=Hesseltinella vesiculosa TaxID=101127 RepID=A0A1X2G8E8_9FUNG|nr:NAD(P)-binding protein [Hesseltinella vesiculosa]
MAAVPKTTEIFKENIFAGKVVLCSGGGSGICYTMTEAMVQHGAKAVIISRSLEKLEKAAAKMRSATGGQVLAVAADVRKPADVENAVKKSIEAFGRIDFLINGAAGNFLAPFEKMSYNAFKTVHEIDVQGTFNLTKAASEHLKASKGSIINVSATLYYTGLPFQSHAGSAKAAVDALTKHWAVELGPFGVRVNGISPGPVGDTEGMSRLGKLRKAGETESRIPLGRQGVTMDIAQSCVFLFSDAAAWITGHTLVVDGGAWMNTSFVDYPSAVLSPPTSRL